MSMRADKVYLNGVSKRYGDVVALRETTLSFREGEFITLLGPSGSGKTTLLNLIAGMVAPSAGEIWIDGRNVTAVPANKRELGMVFQHYALMPHMTIFENVAFPLRVRRVAKAEIARRVHEALDLVRLPHVASRKPAELSGGQQQRIAIARCIIYNPSIILMDEPLGALDKKLREELQLELKRLHAALGMTIVYVTHDQEEALTMSDRIVLMNKGEIEQTGGPDDLYFRPRTRFAATFLGSSNIIEGRVAAAGDPVEVETGLGLVRARASDRRFDVGEQVAILVRPEAMTLEPSTPSPDHNVVRGSMGHSIAYGGMTKSFINLDAGPPLAVQQLTRSNLGGPAIGQPVVVGWAPADSVILPEDR